MISAHRLIFNGFSTEDFDVIPYLSFDEDNGAVSSFLNADGIYTEHYDGHRTIHRAKYNEALTPRFTLIKKDYGDFDTTENRKILSWLTVSEKPGWLEVYKDDSNVLEWRIFGCITSVEQYKLGNGRIVGYEFEMESSHPYAWSRKFTYPEIYNTVEEISNNDETNDYLVVSGTEEFIVTCNTDEYNKLLYPKVTINFKGKNEYFPINVNPLEDIAYPMVPNVIYSWFEEYRKAVEYKPSTVYYSDKNGTKAGVQPTTQTEITNGNYFIKVDETHLYVNLNGIEDNGKYEIQALSSDEIIQEYPPIDYKYYLLPNGYIYKLTTNDDNEYMWKSVALIGMAVKISNTYMFDNSLTTKEAIIAGGTMDEVVVLDGANKIISGTKSTSARIIGDDFNWEWIPLVYGKNTITVSGNCTIKFEWLEPRKVGSL